MDGYFQHSVDVKTSFIYYYYFNNRRRVTAPLNFSVELLRKFLLHDLGSWSPTRIEVILSQNRSDAL